jgi:hypothetical protein
MSQTQTAPGKPGAVSRALASDRLGIPALAPRSSLPAMARLCGQCGGNHTNTH